MSAAVWPVGECQSSPAPREGSPAPLELTQHSSFCSTQQLQKKHTCATSAAMALGPRSSPSTMPAAMASTFFREPQISTPMTSAAHHTGAVGSRRF